MESSNKSQLMSMDIYILPSGFFKGSLAPHVGKYIQFLTFPGSVSKEAFRLQVVFKPSEGTQKKLLLSMEMLVVSMKKLVAPPDFWGVN